MSPPDALPKPIVRRTYKYRIYPTRGQVDALNAQLRSACDLYNAALQQRRDAYREHKISIGFYDQSAEFPAVRAAGLLAEGATAHSQRYVLRQLDHTFQGILSTVEGRRQAGVSPLQKLATIRHAYLAR